MRCTFLLAFITVHANVHVHRRVGFVEVQDSQKVNLPASLEDIEQHYDVIDKVPNAPAWDFMWTVVAEEAREKQFAHCGFTTEVGDMPPVASYESDFLQVADAAVKVGNMQDR